MFTFFAIVLYILITLVAMGITFGIGSERDGSLNAPLVLALFLEGTMGLCQTVGLVIAPNETQIVVVGEDRGVRVTRVTYPGVRVPAWTTEACRVENTGDRVVRVEGTGITKGTTWWAKELAGKATAEFDGICPHVKIYNKKGALLTMIRYQ